MIPSYLIDQLKAEEQWKRTLYVIMKTWNHICAHEEFWIFGKNNIYIVFEWHTKQFYFCKQL